MFIDQTANCDLQYAFLLCCCHKKAQFPLVFVSDTALNVLESCLLLFVWQCSYSSLSNKRAGWNKRAGRKFCQILGNFENSNLCWVDLSHF